MFPFLVLLGGKNIRKSFLHVRMEYPLVEV